ncbi:MAG TPA: oxidoreductase [Thermoguttaceae bacterium]|nr:oxidoreductase [Thermoguttaceae bacterium]
MKHLGIEKKHPRIGVFDFTGCEGCQLQLANKEETLGAFLAAIEVVNFREISSDHGDDYDVAFVDGAVSRADEVERLQAIRRRAKLLVALGSCACFGGVNRLKNAYDLDEANREVYGDCPKQTMPTRSVKEVVAVDLELPGCPVNKDEIERVVQHLVWDLPLPTYAYPVCLECKQRYTVCRFDLGELCLGPITRAGCGAPCPAGGLGCWGCRGPAEAPNYEEFFTLTKEKGFDDREVKERLDFFGGFEGVR